MSRQSERLADDFRSCWAVCAISAAAVNISASVLVKPMETLKLESAASS
ncbi:MAG: hypothetical protein RI953_2187, partial [Pseudomonadota bacterium]